uniref:Centromere protein S n=2 Tax=Oryza glaberrima TaxID=4538 RepID=I1PKT3_ORYGL
MDAEMDLLADEDGGEAERLEAAEAQADLLRDRLRLAVISIATSEGKKAGMEVSDPVVACIADLAYKTVEQLAKDVELFAQHAGRKSIKMEDVILTAHRNEHLMGLLRTFSQELKGKEPSSERKRKKSSKKDDNAIRAGRAVVLGERPLPIAAVVRRWPRPHSSEFLKLQQQMGALPVLATVRWRVVIVPSVDYFIGLFCVVGGT